MSSNRELEFVKALLVLGPAPYTPSPRIPPNNVALDDPAYNAFVEKSVQQYIESSVYDDTLQVYYLKNVFSRHDMRHRATWIRDFYKWQEARRKT